MKLYGASQRFVCALLSVLLAVMAPLCAYAADYGIASSSDADVSLDGGSDGSSSFAPEADAWIQQMTDMIVVDPAGLPAEPGTESVFDSGSVADIAEYDPLANLTEEQYAAYCQSFIDHPSVLLDYPKGVPQPRFALSLSAAAVCALCILGAAVGLVFTWNLSSWVNGYSGYDFFSGFEQYQRINHPDDSAFWSGWDAILGSSWGQVIFGVNPVYGSMKRYCEAEVGGYGTDVSNYTISGTSDSIVITEPSKIYLKKDFSITFTRVDAPIYSYIITNPFKPLGAVFFVSSGAFANDFTGESELINGFCVSIMGVGSAGILNDYLSSGYLTYLGDYEFSGGNYRDLVRLLFNSDFVLGSNTATISPDKFITDAQQKEFVAPADIITLPVDQTAADALAGQVSAATDAAGVAGVLAPNWELGDVKEGEKEEDPVLPWVPDITGWLEKLLHGIEAVPGEVAGAFSGFGEKVEALPHSIAQALEDTLIGEDDGTYQISSVVVSKFPFCIPFDLVGCFRVLQSEATPPVWRIPFVVDNSFIHINEEIVIDLSDWERPAAVIRFFVLLMFIFGLAYITRYVVKG